MLGVVVCNAECAAYREDSHDVDEFVRRPRKSTLGLEKKEP